MLSKFPSTHLKPFPAPPNSLFSHERDNFSKFGHPAGHSSERRLKFKVLGQSPGDKWKLSDVDTSAVQQRVNSWLSKAQYFLNEVTSPLVKPPLAGKPAPVDAIDTQEMEEMFMTEHTISSKTPSGVLSPAAIVSIEQFSRLNGLTGFKMQKIFKALVSPPIYNDARNLVEYCCFRFLSRDNSAIHPSLKEPAFQRLVFITMLAWESPYRKGYGSENTSLQGKLVGEGAFVRIAPAISGVADRATVHNLFRALSGDGQGISLDLWLTYVDELIKVNEGRKSYQTREHAHLSEERILCIGSSKKRPVLKWEKNIAWPGKVTLTDRALYFEAVGLLGQKDAIRFDLTRNGILVEKTKVGPLGSDLFDSAVAISSGPESERWVLEFVDFGGELRRDVWFAFIKEVISLHQFIREFGPEDGDKSMFQVYGAQKGKERATISALNSIARLQALQFMQKMVDDPIKLAHFSYLQSVPYGDIVCQTLAVGYWSGPLVKKSTEVKEQAAPVRKLSEEVLGTSNNVIDIDGSIYLQKWMRSPSWSSSASLNFWKNASMTQGLVLSKNLVVADLTLVERAALTCKEKCRVVEKTQETIDAAMIKGIPSNIDLFKELLLPLALIAKYFDKLRRWEEPHLTISFLVFSYSVIFRNLLPYVFPMMLVSLATGMLTLKGLKEQGRLGRYFGIVTIRDQPSSNTIQKIIALKDAMRDVENYLQNLNVTLLKIRTVVLSGQSQITTEIALVLFSFAIVLLVVPFKYVLAFFLADLFTRELEFRREMVESFRAFVKERWDTVHASPVVVLPFESDESTLAKQNEEMDE